MDNPEKLGVQGTQDEEKKLSKNTTQYNMCWTPLYATITNNVNKT